MLSLKKSAQQALLWSAGLNLLRDVLQFGQMLILVRLLDPAIYGMAGLAKTFIGFIGLASFQHVITHVLQVRIDKEVNYHEHFTAGLALNTFLFLLTNVIAFGIAHLHAYSHLQPLLHLLSLTFILSVPVDMRVKMLERDHDWSRVRGLQMVGIVVSIVSAVGLAVSGFGVYALIIPGLLSPIVFVIDLFVFSGWRPKWQWKYTSYREALHFGLNRAGSSAMNGGRQLLQNTLIAQHYQFSGLGIFGRADALANMFCRRISQEVSGALYPVITRADAQSERFQRISGLVLRTVVWMVTPIAVFFSVESENIVALLFGDKWLGVVPLLPLVMVSGLTTSIGATAYRLLLANEQSLLCLRSDVVAFLIAATVMFIFIPYGLYEFLVGLAVVNCVVAAGLLTVLVRTRGVQANSLLDALTPPVLSASASGLCVWMWLGNALQNLPIFFELILSGALFFSFYILVLRLIYRKALAEIVAYVPAGKRIGSLLRLNGDD